MRWLLRSRLSDTAQRLFPQKHECTKEQTYYEIYDSYFPKQRSHFSLVELGIYTGESLTVFGTHYPNARILGIDIESRNLHLPQNVTCLQCDQSDQPRLRALVSGFSSAPDIIIDDASHFGGPVLASFDALFPIVKEGGIYVIEDWGTGYWSHWGDGAMRQPVRADYQAKRFPSHDFGLVGAVKSLIDRIGDGGIREIMFHQWLVIIRKS
jgi:hypothetical protein